MSWPKRLLFASPVVVAAVLNALITVADRLHLRREHIAGFAFLFGAPWDWLLDHACLWLLLRGLGFKTAHGK